MSPVRHNVPIPPRYYIWRSEFDEMQPGSSIACQSEREADTLAKRGRYRGWKMIWRKCDGKPWDIDGVVFAVWREK